MFAFEKLPGLPRDRIVEAIAPVLRSHGLAGVALVGLVIAHVYFAVRPEKWWITKSMIVGWITRRQYLEHHDPQRWVAR